MVKKEPREVEKKEKAVVIPEPIDEIKEKIIVAEPADERRYTKEEREAKRRENDYELWAPKTELGKNVKAGKVKDIDEILDSGKKILEHFIIDRLIPDLSIELIAIGQAKGKFGGGKRRFWRQTQRKTAEGNVPSFACMAVVGDSKGHVGLGMGKARETLPAKEKAIRDAKLSIIKVARGCGSFDCSCTDKHSILFKTEGKVGSSIMKLIPASKGTGLVIDDECKKIMKAAGIKDVYSRTFGQTRTKINLAMACFDALRKISEVKK